MGIFDYLLEKGLEVGAYLLLTKNENVSNFVSKQTDKNNKYIEDVFAMREKYDMTSKSEEELKALYKRTSNEKVKKAIQVELSERGN